MRIYPMVAPTLITSAHLPTICPVVAFFRAPATVEVVAKIVETAKVAVVDAIEMVIPLYGTICKSSNGKKMTICVKLGCRTINSGIS